MVKSKVIVKIYAMRCVMAGGYSGEPVDGLGECVIVEGFDDVLCMAWKSDNAGPHDIAEAYTHPHECFFCLIQK